MALTASQKTIQDQAPHHAGLNFLKVICLSIDFGLQKVDVSLISRLLLEEGEREQKIWNEKLALCCLRWASKLGLFYIFLDGKIKQNSDVTDTLMK